MTIYAALAPIYTIQKRRDEEAHHSLKEYVEQTHRHVQEMEATYGLTLRYGQRVGGYESVSHPSSLPRQSKKDDAPVET